MNHNTQMMLKNYRDIVWALECFPERVAEELNQPLENLDQLLGTVDLRLALGDTRLEHKLLSIKEPRLLLDRVNDALTVLRQKPGNGEQMYDVIYQTFITPDSKRQISRCLAQVNGKRENTIECYKVPCTLE